MCDKETLENIKEALKHSYNLFESLSHGQLEDGYYSQELQLLGDYCEFLGIRFDD